jgi:DNA-binding NtrC family response regulator
MNIMSPMNDPTLLGSSTAIQRVRSFVARAAPSSATVLITGETGTGKEVVARALHAGSPRASGPFVAVSCAALPEGLLESELFGHERGAFTGAVASHPGRFELADGGTLFLDEVGEMTPAIQAKLLRALQDRRFERVGGTKTMTVDTRVVAATNRKLEDEVAAGRFRADLYYRLRVLQVEMPPLRDRPEDLLLLWDHFVAEAAAREGRPAPTTSVHARNSIRNRKWEGNTRELENAAWHAVVMTAGQAKAGAPAVIDEPHLPANASDQPAPTTIIVPGMTMKEIERTAILAAVRAIGTVRGAAQALGISERKVHYKLRSYELEMRRRPRLFLAEDDDELRWALSAALAARGYEVSAHAGGEPLLDELSHLDDDSGEIAGVVSDVRMDGLNGFDVVSRVKEAKIGAPIVLVTAFHDGETKARAEKMGTTLLAKPFSVDDLCAVLKREAN